MNERGEAFHDQPVEALRGMALAALAGGAMASAALMSYAAWRVHAPRVLLVGFTLWVLAPFAFLALADALSKRSHWSLQTRRALYRVVFVVAAASPIIYAVFALGGNRPRTAPFVLLAPISAVAAALVIALAALRSRQSRVEPRR
jgi:hypothetical protein